MAGSFNMYFPTQDKVHYNPKEVITFYIISFPPDLLIFKLTTVCPRCQCIQKCIHSYADVCMHAHRGEEKKNLCGPKSVSELYRLYRE
jgi:hypothetical protein